MGAVLPACVAVSTPRSLFVMPWQETGARVLCGGRGTRGGSPARQASYERNRGGVFARAGEQHIFLALVGLVTRAGWRARQPPRPIELAARPRRQEETDHLCFDSREPTCLLLSQGL
jgi:hypothetical protein